MKNTKLNEIEQNWQTIEDIKNPSQDEQLMAIKMSDGIAIQTIENPTEEAQKLAIQFDIENISFIENPTEETLMLCQMINSNIQNNYSEEEKKCFILDNFNTTNMNTTYKVEYCLNNIHVSTFISILEIIIDKVSESTLKKMVSFFSLSDIMVVLKENKSFELVELLEKKILQKTKSENKNFPF
jgi:hypothetical protein